MTIEKLVYKLEPAGHEEPPQKRKYDHSQKYSKLAQCFERWREEPKPPFDSGVFFALAESCLTDVFSAEEAHAFFLTRQEEIETEDGFFLSAIYKRAPDPIIIFDLEMDLDYFGYGLPKGKTLINFGKVYRSAAYNSNGTFINYGKIYLSAGAYNKGLIINYAPWDELYPAEETEGPFFNLDTKFRHVAFGTRACKLSYLSKYLQISVMQGEPVFTNSKHQELLQYIDMLKSEFEKGRKDYKKVLKALQQLGKDPTKKINKDIEDILRRAGYNVK